MRRMESRRRYSSSLLFLIKSFFQVVQLCLLGGNLSDRRCGISLHSVQQPPPSLFASIIMPVFPPSAHADRWQVCGSGRAYRGQASGSGDLLSWTLPLPAFSKTHSPESSVILLCLMALHVSYVCMFSDRMGFSRETAPRVQQGTDWSLSLPVLTH